MIELIILLVMIYLLFGSPWAGNYGTGPRVSLLGLVVILIICWWFLGLPYRHGGWYY